MRQNHKVSTLDAHNFNTLNGVDWNPIKITIVFVQYCQFDINPFPVNQDERVAAAKATNADTTCAITAEADIDTGLCTDRLRNIRYSFARQRIGIDDRYTGWRIAKIVRNRRRCDITSC